MEEILFEKSIFSRDGAFDSPFIRWGLFDGSDDEVKLAAFKISGIDASVAKKSGVDIYKISETIIDGKLARSGPKHQTYEWDGRSFVSVNPTTQTWFTFR